jgi:eukaryotic-like serine/threonine-protein kinase
MDGRNRPGGTALPPASDDEASEEAILVAQAEARVGQVLRDKYRIERVLGLGGMAAVYIATHRNRQAFAVKMLHPALSLNAAVRARFLGEGYRANSVKHSGVVKVLDDDVAEDGSVFLVMELLEGESLDRVADRHGSRLPVRAVLAIGDQLLDVLAAADAANVVHRDIKPANLFLTRDGTLKVLDFGIARLDTAGGQMTRAGALLGTPGFMAPEQARGQSNEIDGRTDIWAAGATLFSLLAGVPVHDGESAQMLMLSAATQPARSLRTRVPDAPPAVVSLVDRALQFDKAMRWQNAALMRGAIRDAYLQAFGEDMSPAPLLALLAPTAHGTPTAPVLVRTAQLSGGLSGIEETVPLVAGTALLTGDSSTATAVLSTEEPAPRATRHVPPARWPRRTGAVALGVGVAAVAAVAAWWLAFRGPKPAADRAAPAARTTEPTAAVEPPPVPIPSARAPIPAEKTAAPAPTIPTMPALRRKAGQRHQARSRDESLPERDDDPLPSNPLEMPLQ